MTTLIYATTNPGKLQEVQKLLGAHGVAVQGPADFGISLDVDETGSSLEENAVLKAEAYLPLVPNDAVVIGDDTGLEITALGGEPGIKVRRWKGYKMTDDEILNYALLRLRDVPAGERTAQFRTVIAVAKKGIPTRTFAGILPGEILVSPHPIRVPGLPFQPLFRATESGLMLYEIHDLPKDDPRLAHLETHRERAVKAALPYLRSLL